MFKLWIADLIWGGEPENDRYKDIGRFELDLTDMTFELYLNCSSLWWNYI